MFILFCVSVGMWALGCGLLGVGAALAYLGTVARMGGFGGLVSLPIIAGSVLTLLGAGLFAVDMLWWAVVAVWRFLAG